MFMLKKMLSKKQIKGFMFLWRIFFLDLVAGEQVLFVFCLFDFQGCTTLFHRSMSIVIQDTNYWQIQQASKIGALNHSCVGS